MEEDRPLGAFALSLAAGILVILEGFVFTLVGSLASNLGAYAAGDILGFLGLGSIFLGLILVGLAVGLYRAPDQHAGYGIAILIFSLVSLVLGGGFYLGAILGVVGGILAILYAGEPDPIPDIYRSHAGEPEANPFPEISPGPPGPWGGESNSARSAQTSSRRCDNCGGTIPAGARRCPDCETPVPEFRPLRAPARTQPSPGAPGRSP